MKTFFKKASLALFALGVSAGALANGGTVMPSGFHVTVPHQDAGWEVGIEGFYWQPNMHNLAYAQTVDGVDEEDLFIVDGQIHTIEPSYDWGFSVWGTYFFAGQGNDLTLRYTRQRTDDGKTIHEQLDPQNGFFGVFPTKNHLGFTGFLTFEDGRSEVDFDYDVFDLMAGQHIDVGPCVDIRIAAGLRYAKLDTKVTDHFSIVNPINEDEVIKEWVQYESDYNGIGPRVEVDGRYDFNNGFGIVAGAGASILIGSNKVKGYQEDQLVIDHVIENKFSLVGDKGDTQQVVPELDGKLGANYIYNINAGCSLAVEAGWKATHYFDVHQRSRPVGEFSLATLVETASSVNFQGPYLNLALRSA